MNLDQINEKDVAVVLSVFGSSRESAMEEYHNFYNQIREKLNTNIELKMSVSSRHILKKLDKLGKNYKTTIEQLSYLDHAAYYNVVIASINLFPLNEHNAIVNIMNSFNAISSTKYFVTEPLLGEISTAHYILKSLNSKLRQQYGESSLFLYIAHGISKTYHPGNQMFSYIRDYLKLINENNFLYTIEGSYTFEKSLFLNEISRHQINLKSKDLIIVPLLLAAGNHYIKDILPIKEQLNNYFNSVIIPFNNNSENQFSLLSFDEVRNCFYEKIISAIKSII